MPLAQYGAFRGCSYDRTLVGNLPLEVEPTSQRESGRNGRRHIVSPPSGREVVEDRFNVRPLW